MHKNAFWLFFVDFVIRNSLFMQKCEFYTDTLLIKAPFFSFSKRSRLRCPRVGRTLKGMGKASSKNFEN